MKVSFPLSVFALLSAASASNHLAQASEGGFGGEEGGFGGEEEGLGLKTIIEVPEETCGTRPYELRVDGDAFGTFTIQDDLDDMLQIVVDIQGQNLNTANIMVPYVTEMRVDACCKSTSLCSPTIVGRYHDEIVTEASLFVQEPPCADGEAVDINVQVDVEEPGGIDAFKAMFPPEGVPVEYELRYDTYADDNERDSWLDARFLDSDPNDSVVEPLAGKEFDAFCVDYYGALVLGSLYKGRAYSFLNVDWSSADARDSIPGSDIQRLDQMDAVAWCINHRKVGDQFNGKTINSNHMQVATWLIVDQIVEGEAYADGFAREIADDCMARGQGFVPGCDDLIPLIVIPDNGHQNQYIQTTFAKLGITCDGKTGHGEAEALCETGGSGGSGGDPHFKTFGGAWFDFHGGCDLLLADFPSFHNGEGLTVEARTTTRYDYSYIEATAIQIGNDILEISSFGHHLINGISNAVLPALVGDNFVVEYTQPRKNQHLFTIDLEEEKNIVIKVYKDLVYVDLNIRHGHSLEFHDGVGMLGSYFNGTCFGRDGASIITDDIEYGQEWQIRDTDAKLFMIDRAPQWPEKCELPNPVERASRRLGQTVVSVDEASTACTHIKEQHTHGMCVFDVMATSDLSVAKGGAY